MGEKGRSQESTNPPFFVDTSNLGTGIKSACGGGWRFAGKLRVLIIIHLDPSIGLRVEKSVLL